ncbi:ATP-binding cassette domain-containing protein [Cyclobacterium sp. 1_MG-2023]|uniref:ABC transporter ATP-binding protein n=1 Tax=Cyclobacterium sp. 1_MG-2023 TaxID=3062681 RepID=UPI0026E27873|nr:ATP-binding cassette domain-containing protein [Cyclobacterium sp. 1_MG-2023]MDO6437531.1 ATP-binding cassette domain-containing protein [Cyclobacterium sp. 1_MG-2023]
MLSVKLEGAGKKFQREWIFRNLSLALKLGSKTAIIGSNGSGKSTLIKCLSSQMPLTEGKLSFNWKQKELAIEDVYKYLSISAPYLDLPEEFSLKEFLKFHFKFKTPSEGLNIQQIIEIMYLENAVNKPINYFSSGMKQRLKLGLCFFSNSPLMLLDEPTSNLDERGIQWYRDLIHQYGGNKCIFIASNDKREFDFCEEIVSIEDYKLK